MTRLGELLGIHYECEYCIEGFQPSGIDLYLGPVYMACRECLDCGELKVCKSCDSDSLFPADFTCIHCLAVHLARYGLAAVICPDCGGITDFRALDDLTGGTQ
jgi:hypothetical protein